MVPSTGYKEEVWAWLQKCSLMFPCSFEQSMYTTAKVCRSIDLQSLQLLLQFWWQDCHCGCWSVPNPLHICSEECQNLERSRNTLHAYTVSAPSLKLYNYIWNDPFMSCFHQQIFHHHSGYCTLAGCSYMYLVPAHCRHQILLAETPDLLHPLCFTSYL